MTTPENSSTPDLAGSEAKKTVQHSAVVGTAKDTPTPTVDATARRGLEVLGEGVAAIDQALTSAQSRVTLMEENLTDIRDMHKQVNDHIHLLRQDAIDPGARREIDELRILAKDTRDVVSRIDREQVSISDDLDTVMGQMHALTSRVDALTQLLQTMVGGAAA